MYENWILFILDHIVCLFPNSCVIYIHKYIIIRSIANINVSSIYSREKIKMLRKFLKQSVKPFYEYKLRVW